MMTYDGFARIYTRRLWTEYSRGMAVLLPELLQKYGIHQQRALDIACGEGTFIVAMAKAGIAMTGIDLSPEMLRLAAARSESENLNIRLLNGDMREMAFDAEFDLATCWFDSLNYLLSPEDLGKTLGRVARALQPQGYFIFDIRTIYGLMDYFGFNVSLVSHPCAVLLDAPDALVLSRPEWDYAQSTATWRITGFLLENGRWERIEETHRLRGFTLEDVRAATRKSGMTEIDCFGDLLEMNGPGPDSKRLWFVLKKEK
jgi:SAM-dependent methyltransferase